MEREGERKREEERKRDGERGFEASRRGGPPASGVCLGGVDFGDLGLSIRGNPLYGEIPYKGKSLLKGNPF